MSRDAAPPRRCLAVWLGVSALLAAYASWVGPDLTGLVDGAFDVVLVRGCEAVALGCGAWLWIVTTVVTIDVLRGRPHAEHPGVPVVLRRLLLAGCGVALAGGALTVPSYAAQHRPGSPHGGREVLAGLAVPDRATALSQLAAVFEQVRPHRTHHVVVRAGDSLWRLAAATLPPGVRDDQVTRRWHRLYALNRAVIGADPDVIVPGQRLLLPTGSKEEL